MSPFKTSFLSENKLPLVVEPAGTAPSFETFLKQIDENLPFLKEQLLKYGAILFRGFPIDNSEAFAKAVEALKTGELVSYIGGGSPRTKVSKKNVYTSTDAPPEIQIHLHNELSYAENFPTHIFFYCDIAPQEGGETFIGDARKILNSVSPSLKEKLETRGLKYVSRYYYKNALIDFVNKFKRGHKKWTQVFEADTKQEVEEKCKANNIGYKWNQNDWLEISRLRPATMVHPITQDKVWFNQVHLFDYNPRFLGWARYLAMRLFYFRKYMVVDEAYYADGEKIPRKDIYEILDALDKNSIYYPWQKGDMIVLDNILTMHGRAPFKGPRRILTAMTK